MLATGVTEIPRGEGWLFEPKWDGYRALGYVRGGEARLGSRNGNDLTGRFAEIARQRSRGTQTPDVVVDGGGRGVNGSASNPAMAPTPSPEPPARSISPSQKPV